MDRSPKILEFYILRVHCLVKFSRFFNSPFQDIALTASGDGTAHVWKATALPDALGGGGGGGGGFIGGAMGGGGGSSEESAADSSEEDGGRGGGGGGLAAAAAAARDSGAAGAAGGGAARMNVIRQPIVSLTGRILHSFKYNLDFGSIE